MILPPAKSLVEQLSAVLDEEIALLIQKRSQLADLSQAIVDRDDEATEKLLEQIEKTEQVQASVDIRLEVAREALAGAFGCEARELKLTKLIAELPPDQAEVLDYRRRQIIEQAEELRKQHLKTSLLLLESARITGMLLDSMLPGREPVVTYGAGGSEFWRSGAGLLDTEL